MWLWPTPSDGAALHFTMRCLAPMPASLQTIAIGWHWLLRLGPTCFAFRAVALHATQHQGLQTKGPCATLLLPPHAKSAQGVPPGCTEIPRPSQWTGSLFQPPVCGLLALKPLLLAGIRTPGKDYILCLVDGKQEDPQKAKDQKEELILGNCLLTGPEGHEARASHRARLSRHPHARAAPFKMRVPKRLGDIQC